MRERFLSVVMPCYNERATVAEVVARVSRQPMVLEIVAVDDSSTDGTAEELERLARGNPLLRVLRHEHNRGKGAALRTGFAHVRGPVTIVQDADLEYDPADYEAVAGPVFAGSARVVYGARFLNRPGDRPWHVLANRALTWFSNLVLRQHLNDVETCYKALRSDLLRTLPLREDRFGFEPEVTTLLARRGIAIREVPISYRSRGYSEGKKIGAKDALRAVVVLIRRGLLGA